MARLAGAPPRGGDQERAFAELERGLGRVPEPLAVAAHCPEVFAATTSFELAVARAGAMPARLKKLAELRASMLAGCEFCLDIGSMLARAMGVSEDELRDLARWRASDRFSELDRLVLAYAEGITRTPVDVPDDLFEALRAHLDERQLVELTATIAWENWRARFNWAFLLGGEGYSEGAYCVRPDPPAASN